MEVIKLSVNELYHTRHLIDGLVFVIPPKEEGKQAERDVKIKGLLYEPGVKEGTKRQLKAALRTVNQSLEPIEAQRKEIQAYVEEGLSEEELKAKRIQKDKDLIEDSLEIQIEKIDFSRVEDLSFSEDYGFLYERFFK